jgi:predicted transcriptional regulator
MLKTWQLKGTAFARCQQDNARMDSSKLSRRQRQIMTIVFERGEASALEVWEHMPDRPSLTAVRTMLRILEDLGHLRHVKRGRQFVYRPTAARRSAGKSALQTVLQTFYNGSLEQAVAAYLADPKGRPNADELQRLAGLIREARRKETS